MAAQLLQPWPEASKDNSVESVYQKAQAHAQELLPRFKALLEPYVPEDSRLLTDIKTLSSFIRKHKRKSTKKIHDVLRAAILTQTKEEAHEVAEKIKKGLKVVEYDFKEHPDQDICATGYYGSFHIKIKLSDMICEIQVMTETLWVYKERSHSSYANQDAENDRSVKTFSNWLYNTANRESA
jgi:hypothetical protein